MCKVKIISGTYGYRKGNRIEPKDRRSDPFLLDDLEAQRLVSLGIAKIVADTVATPFPEEETSGQCVSMPENEILANGDLGEDPVMPDIPYTERPEYSVQTNVSDLREIGKQIGIIFHVGTTKEEMVAILDERFNEYFADDAPPLAPADPVE